MVSSKWPGLHVSRASPHPRSTRWSFFFLLGRQDRVLHVRSCACQTTKGGCSLLNVQQMSSVFTYNTGKRLLEYFLGTTRALFFRLPLHGGRERPSQYRICELRLSRSSRTSRQSVAGDRAGPFNFSGASSERPQLRLGAGMGNFVHGGLRRRVGSSDIRLVSAVRAAGDGPACFFQVPHSTHLLAAAHSNENLRSRDALFLMGVGTLVLWRCRGVSSLRAWPKTTTHPMLWKVHSLLMAQPS